MFLSSVYCPTATICYCSITTIKINSYHIHFFRNEGSIYFTSVSLNSQERMVYMFRHTCASIYFVAYSLTAKNSWYVMMRRCTHFWTFYPVLLLSFLLLQCWWSRRAPTWQLKHVSVIWKSVLCRANRYLCHEQGTINIYLRVTLEFPKLE